MTSYRINLLQRNECPLCRSNYKILQTYASNSNILKKYFINKYNCNLIIDNEYSIAKCNNCKFLFQVNVPDSNSMKVLYEQIINFKVSRRNFIC